MKFENRKSKDKNVIPDIMVRELTPDELERATGGNGRGLPGPDPRPPAGGRPLFVAGEARVAPIVEGDASWCADLPDVPAGTTP